MSGIRSGKRPVRRSGDARGYGLSRRIVNALPAILLAAAALGAPALAQAPAEPRLLVLGDSLTAGYGLPSQLAFPARLQAALRASGIKGEVVNAGVSGDTSAGGLARLNWVLAGAPVQFAIVELGANDALRGLDPQHMESNLDQIIARLRARGVAVLLAGMKAPRNLGREYGEQFDAVFPRLAQKHGVALYPFFLDGVAADSALNQADGIHPNAQGVEVIVARILPHVKRLLDTGA